MAVEAAALAGWSSEDAATAKLTVLAGGMTGRTFKLTATAGKEEDGAAAAASRRPPLVVRSLRVDEDAGLVEATRVLAAAGITPPVVAASATLLVSEFVAGSPPGPADLKAGGEQIAAVARLVAKLHSLDIKSLNECRPARQDELELFIGWAEKSIPAVGKEVFQLLRDEAAACKQAFGSLRGPAGATVIGHGDLHPGNVLLHSPAPASSSGEGEANAAAADAAAATTTTTAWLVDLEHLCPRAAAEDIAYFFVVWGDLRYAAGWKPSAEAPTPYPPLAARRAFATSYLQQLGRSGSDSSSSVETAAAATTAEAVDAFLYEVERAVVAQRVKLMAIWLLIAQGNPEHMLVGGVSAFLPYVARARELLGEAEKEGEERRQKLVERGVITVAAAEVAAEREAAKSPSSQRSPQEVE